MTGDLLLREHWDPQITAGENIKLLIGEFRIDPELQPFLVSGWGARTIVWVSGPMKDVIRAAVRDDGVGDFYWEVVRAVVKKGRVGQWGNSFNLDKKGIDKAIAYVQGYDLGKVTLLCSPNRVKYLKRYFKQYDYAVADWLQEDWVVVVPEDRGYLGWLSTIEGHDGHFISVVHNSSRGIAVARKQKDATVA